MPDLMSYIKDLDVRTPQVALRAKIISVNRTSIEQLGISYDLASPGGFFNTLVAALVPGGQPSPTLESQVELGGEALAGIANANRKYRIGSALNLLFSTAIGKFSLTTFLDALREQQPRRPPGRAEHRDARQPRGRDPRRSGNADPRDRRRKRRPGRRARRARTCSSRRAASFSASPRTSRAIARSA